MPFIYDFNRSLSGIKEISVNPKGWVNNLIVEYCIAQAHPYDTMASVCWRVKGTTHTFTIYEHKLKVSNKDDYAKHFTEILEAFREDYLSWFKEEEYRDCEWKWDYKREYGEYIQ